MADYDSNVMIIQRIKNVCKGSTLLSFIIGTILLILFLISRKFGTIVSVGVYYVVIAFWFNVVIFFITLLSACYYWKNRIELFSHCVLLLINLPIAICYFFTVINLI